MNIFNRFTGFALLIILVDAKDTHIIHRSID